MIIRILLVAGMLLGLLLQATIVSAGISPGKVIIENYRTEYEVKQNIKVCNTNAEAVPFTVTFQIPSRVDGGYEKAPPEAIEWVYIAKPTFTLGPDEERLVPIIFEIPKGAETPQKFEFRIVVSEDVGNVRVAESSRWLVSMADKRVNKNFWISAGIAGSVAIGYLAYLVKKRAKNEAKT